MNSIRGNKLSIKRYGKKYFGIISILILGLLPLYALFNSGFPLTHDGMDHIARIANFYKGLSEGNIFPRWGENLNWGYGHPILMFLYPLSSYASSFFHLLGNSYVDSLKFVFAIGFVSSGLTMYLWARKQFNEYYGITAGLLYMYAPYRFIDMYVRGAIGEHVAFIFPPLVLYFLYQYFNTKKERNETLYLLGIAISCALLLLAHNAISLMFMPLIASYAVFLAYSSKNYKKLFMSFLSFVWGILLSGFFTFPAFFEGKFTLRDIVTGDEYKTRFVTNPLAFIYGQWSYGITGQFSVQIGLANIIGLLLTPLVFLKTKKKDIKILLLILSGFFVFSIFIMLPQSNFFYLLITTFKKFQFPWRFLTLTVFTTSILAPSIFLVIKNPKIKVFALVIFICILIFSTFSYWNANGYFNRSDAFYNTIYSGTTDTGESSPIWSIRFMEHRPNAHAEVITGTAKIVERQRKSTKHAYHITVTTENARIRENTLYFPNWQVIADGKPVDTQFQDPSERGLITYYLPKGKHNVDVVFKDTKLRVVSSFVSLLSLAAIIIVGLHALIRKIRKPWAQVHE